jgi:hypothetical protein
MSNKMAWVVIRVPGVRRMRFGAAGGQYEERTGTEIEAGVETETAS